ncbi:MFS inorganic phosphate transporter [Mycena sanguinolenta]|uniref:MFS inorganic phosphate transporter n=1 Tax=Mycena sanguinolenta TaxID=230812 RepID=A0A8H7CY66_9AGAR|nr:MFS inorganic phosphate transporter [Mycena sanguinolenta]
MPGSRPSSEDHLKADKSDASIHVRAGLEEIDQGDGRPPFILTYTEIKLLMIAGVGFFLDAYDLFVINPVATMLQYRLYGGNQLPAALQGLLKAAANIGSVIGQFLFGYLADSLGRKAICACLTFSSRPVLQPLSFLISEHTPQTKRQRTDAHHICDDFMPYDAYWLYKPRWFSHLPIGIPYHFGHRCRRRCVSEPYYPMSASVTSDRAVLRKRGTMLAYIFSNQGWGSFVGSLVTVVVLAAYKKVMDDEGETSKVDGVWRIVVGLSLIPAFGTLYQRLTLAESTRFLASQKTQSEKLEDEKTENERTPKRDDAQAEPDSPVETTRDSANVPEIVKKKAYFREFLVYFSEWRHMKILIGTSMCWFFLDIAFYGINLNQNVVLQEIGFDGSSGSAWEKLFKVSVGNVIITALGFVPGYYASILLIEVLGRKWIQIQGFIMAAVFLAILAGKFHTLSKPGFIVCFSFLQFFFNFGANTTTYCYPAEVFPTRFRASAHGLSAAAGKAGAIISALAFNSLSNSIGTDKVLWIFVGCCFAGAIFTLLLPEVRRRDPDQVFAEEMEAARLARKGNV